MNCLKRSKIRPQVEALETRSVPAVGFNQVTGLLSVTGDEAGPSSDFIQTSVTAGEFVEVTINGTVHSSDPGSANFDATLDGASAASVLSIHVRGLDGNDLILLGDGFSAAAGQITLDGGSGSDQIVGSAEAEILLGGIGDDVLMGGGGDDTLRGLQGNDTIGGGAGNDLVLGAAGDDSLRGGVGDDSIRGGYGDDELSGGAGIDTVLQTVDADQTLTDTQLSGQGLDLLAGIERAELTGGAGDNLIYATEFFLGPVTLNGGSGDDWLIGTRDGDDLIRGEDGDDWLNSIVGDWPDRLSPGDDSLYGGAGSDRFSVNTLFRELVKDLTAEDILDLQPFEG